MTQTDPEMAELDALLAASRPPAPSEEMMGRILADALSGQPVPVARVRPSWLARTASLLGGWQGLGGLVAATCAGFWIGLNPPASLPDGLSVFLDAGDSFAQNDPGLNGFGWDMEEG